ncbi:MAG TPA: hypothetical protein PLN85_04770 [archaeon]|nr:hypothetical protein [archaeon]
MELNNIDLLNFFVSLKSIFIPTVNNKNATPISERRRISGVFCIIFKTIGPNIIPVMIYANNGGCFSLLNIYAINVAKISIIQTEIKMFCTIDSSKTKMFINIL